MNAKRKSGFSLVELMVGMLAASVLAITIGAMLYYSYKGWKSVQAISAMERDGSLAMSTMSRVIRGASLGNIAIINSGSGVIVSNVNGFVAQQFRFLNGKLSYSRTGAGGMDLVQTGVKNFVCSADVSNHQVKVTLDLTNTAEVAMMRMTNVVTLRN